MLGRPMVLAIAAHRPYDTMRIPAEASSMVAFRIFGVALALTTFTACGASGSRRGVDTTAGSGAERIAGRLPPPVIQAIVRARYPRFQTCYSAGLGRDPQLEGRGFKSGSSSGEMDPCPMLRSIVLRFRTQKSCVVSFRNFTSCISLNPRVASSRSSIRSCSRRASPLGARSVFRQRLKRSLSRPPPNNGLKQTRLSLRSTRAA